MALESWKFDPVHSSIGFSARHLMISRVHGVFQKWTGTLAIDEQHPQASKVDVEIEAASIDTKEPQRDEHLRSADFLDAANHPTLTFHSTNVEKVDDEQFRITGDLTIRGITKSVVLETEYFGKQKDPWGGERAGFSAKTTINRKDYGLMFNVPLEGGGILVGDKVEITLDIQAIRESAQKAA